MDYEYLAELLYPDITETPEDMERRFPPRELPEGAAVTRFAPSPTGFVHFGGLFPTRVSERLAHRSGGVFILRIEDTDSKREVEGAEENLIRTLESYGIAFDEGTRADGSDDGAYGPYHQSQRAPIYHVYAKQLVREGKAYPCFCTHEELDAIRAEQEAEKFDPGYYGRFAIWRDAPIERIREKLDAHVPFVLRMRSEGDVNNKFKFNDLIKGTVDVTENHIDHVIIKSDGIPPYHFAHPIDDHLMRVTHVVRGEEWLPSLPIHLQLFRMLGFRAPKYLHISQLMKLEGNSKKKLSKRDHGTDMRFYDRSGYPAAALTEYIMTLLNSNYEEWRAANPAAPFEDFAFSVKKMSPSGCLFDLDKLGDVCRNTVSRMSADEVYDGVLTWARSFAPDFADTLAADPGYARRIFSIGRGGSKPRKDLTTWADAVGYTSLFYDKTFVREESYDEAFDTADIRATLKAFAASYDETADATAWFDSVKAIAADIGFAPEMKLYRQNPEAYRGHVGDVSGFIRIAVTGRKNSPDLYEIMQILGRDRVIARVNGALGVL